MTVLYLDTETYSETPIAHGTHRYAENAEVMIATWAFDDGPVETLEFPARGDIEELVEAADVVVIHNSAFDRTVLRHALSVDIPLDKVFDTMACALSHSLPGSLGKLCSVMGVPADEAKDAEGKTLIQLFCKPRPKNQKLRRATRDTHPGEWAQFLRYAGSDILAMRALYRKLPRWNYALGSNEHALWQLDQRINSHGIRVDKGLALSAIAACKLAKDGLAERTQEITDGQVQAATQRDQLLKYILECYGITLPDMQKGTLERRIEDPDLPDIARELLVIRLSASSTSVSKYQRLVEAVSADGRLRGTLQFCGASRTGRWAGRLFQPQNLPRTPDDYTPERQETEIALFKAGMSDCLPDVIESASFAIRGAMVAGEGKRLVVADLANIEGRVLAWLAGEEWKIQAFKDYDRGEGPDLYKVTAARILNKLPADVTKHERQVVGKVPELACLTGDTLVLTQGGLVRLDMVTKDHQLWDGVEWVTHDGLVSKGERATVQVAGVAMTADHLVMAGRCWLPAQTVVSSDSALSHALEDGLESLKSWASSENLLAGYSASRFNVPAAPPRTRSAYTISYGGRRQGATHARNVSRDVAAKNGLSTLLSFLTLRTADDSATAYLLALIGATTRATRGIKTMVVAASECSSLGARIAPPSSPTLSPSTGGIGPSLNSTDETSTKATNPGILGSLRNRQTETTSAKCQTCSSESKTLRPVYDIANAGPRNRFTVVSPDGNALLVHNCGYQGAAGAFGSMAKIYGLDLAPEEVLRIVRQWRDTNSNIVRFWYDMEDAARGAVAAPGHVFEVGRIAVKREGAWLRIRLPSERVLCYPSPRVEWVKSPCMKCQGDGKVTTDDGDVKCSKCAGTGNVPRNQLTYAGVNQYTRKWERIKTYGGKLCIAQGTPVLTHAGWVPIEHVTARHRVWDGEQFVTHDGLAYQGVKGVISAHGVNMTPEHLVLTAKGWVVASQSERYNRAVCRLPDREEILAEQRATVPVAGGLHVREHPGNGRERDSEASTQGHNRVVWVPSPGDAILEATHAFHVKASRVFGMELDARPMPSADAPRMAQLRRARDYCMRRMGEIFFDVLERHGAFVPPGRGVDAGPQGQQRPLPEIKLSLGVEPVAGEEHAAEPSDRHATREDAGLRSGRGEQRRGYDSALPGESRVPGESAVRSPPRRVEPVYDLVNCGPRKRFVVRSEDGRPLIVHNCENVVQATARDVIAAGMQNADRAGFEVLLSVHDEIITETGRDDLDLERLVACMTQGIGGNMPWTDGLPLAAEGFERGRYMK